MAEDALLAAWRLRGKRFHYTRTAGRFAEWRAAQARPTSASSPSTRSLNVSIIPASPCKSGNPPFAAAFFASCLA
jgi:hypothetical protein